MKLGNFKIQYMLTVHDSNLTDASGVIIFKIVRRVLNSLASGLNPVTVRSDVTGCAILVRLWKILNNTFEACVSMISMK
jgi:hypothetical protein